MKLNRWEYDETRGIHRDSKNPQRDSIRARPVNACACQRGDDCYHIGDDASTSHHNCFTCKRFIFADCCEIGVEDKEDFICRFCADPKSGNIFSSPLPATSTSSFSVPSKRSTARTAALQKKKVEDEKKKRKLELSLEQSSARKKLCIEPKKTKPKASIANKKTKPSKQPDPEDLLSDDYNDDDNDSNASFSDHVVSVPIKTNSTRPTRTRSMVISKPTQPIPIPNPLLFNTSLTMEDLVDPIAKLVREDNSAFLILEKRLEDQQKLMLDFIEKGKETSKELRQLLQQNNELMLENKQLKLKSVSCVEEKVCCKDVNLEDDSADDNADDIDDTTCSRRNRRKHAQINRRSSKKKKKLRSPVKSSPAKSTTSSSDYKSSSSSSSRRRHRKRRQRDKKQGKEDCFMKLASTIESSARVETNNKLIDCFKMSFK